MICECTFVHVPYPEAPYFESDKDASDIILAYTSGEEVTFYFKNNESGGYTPGTYMITTPMYISLERYMPSKVIEGVPTIPSFGLATASNNMHTVPYDFSSGYLSTAKIAQNGKLHIEVYYD